MKHARFGNPWAPMNSFIPFFPLDVIGVIRAHVRKVLQYRNAKILCVAEKIESKMPWLSALMASLENISLTSACCTFPQDHS
jgi:hypothetical protein